MENKAIRRWCLPVSGYLFAVLLAFPLAGAQAPLPDSPAVESRARAMVAKLTLAQKIELLGGVDSMYTHAAPSIGFPRLKMSDASFGLRSDDMPSTVYAAGAALAAAWDPELARRLGQSLGRDARARGVHILLGPGVNIARSPVNGRNFEYLSEDPFLNSALAVAFIEGVQSEGVVATVKHYAANNSEYNRHNIDAEIDERTLREIYLPAFEAAVKQGHVGAVMNSYNLLNGAHATQNQFLNLKVLKGEWGFDGVLMSDWVATYDGVAAANHGLDLEMPSARFMNEAVLAPAVKDGRVKESTIDDKLLRLFRLAIRYRFLDRPQFDPSDSTYSVADDAVALEGARESLTLLKNDGKLLPLDPGKIKTIAVFGPDAYPAVPVAGGSAQARAFDAVSILSGVAKVAGPGIKVLYARGLPTENQFFQATKWFGPVKVESFENRSFSGSPSATTQSDISDWTPVWFFGGAPQQRSQRYTAKFRAEKRGKYLLLAAASDGDAYNVTVDGKQLLAQQHAEGQVPHWTLLDLDAGQEVTVVAEYLPDAPGAHLGVGIADQAELVSPEVKRDAALADAVVVAAGFSPESEGEGQDRSFALPWGQDELIRTAAAINPHTIVTLTAGGAVDTRLWLDKVPALIDTFYPGQEGGTAVAEAIFGKWNPEGRLPVSFDHSWEEDPSYPFYYPIPGADTVLHVTESNGKKVDYTIQHVKYGERLMVGYRYWTTMGKHPLFPFGFGLSYTRFAFDHLTVPASAPAGSTVEVSFDVTNSGLTAGAEVAEVYVSDPSAKADRPERELKDFEKVRLAAGETKHVTMRLDARAFSYWDEAAHRWTTDPGKFVVRVGDSSEDTPLEAALTLN